MLAHARYKLGIDDKAIQASRLGSKSTQEEFLVRLSSRLYAAAYTHPPAAFHPRGRSGGEWEVGGMNDDEVNEIIARVDGEEQTFHKVGIQRDREALEK